MGRAEDAVQALRDNVIAERERLGEPHDFVGRSLSLLGQAQLATGAGDDAGANLRAALANFEELPPDHPRVQEVRRLLDRG